MQGSVYPQWSSRCVTNEALFSSSSRKDSELCGSHGILEGRMLIRGRGGPMPRGSASPFCRFLSIFSRIIGEMTGLFLASGEIISTRNQTVYVTRIPIRISTLTRITLVIGRGLRRAGMSSVFADPVCPFYPLRFTEPRASPKATNSSLESPRE